MSVRELAALWTLFRISAALWLVIGTVAGVIAALITRSMWSAVALAPWAVAQAGEEYTRRQLRTALEKAARERE